MLVLQICASQLLGLQTFGLSIFWVPARGTPTASRLPVFPTSGLISDLRSCFFFQAGNDTLHHLFDFFFGHRFFIIGKSEIYRY